MHRVRRTVLHGCGHGAARHPYWLGLAAITAALLVLDRRALLGVDWGLLVTFAAFFHLLGQHSWMEPVRTLFRQLLAHGAMPVAALTSQVISNVPAAILLSQFTDDYPALLVGVNIGRAGTLVASLASLITFRGVYEARQGTDRTVPGTVLRRQLRLFGPCCWQP